jgi:signal transduction histidine kinase
MATENGSERERSRVRAALTYLAGWTVVAVLFAANSIVVYYYQLRRLPNGSSYPYGPKQWLQTVPGALADWYLWALLSPVVVWLARRIRIERERWLAAVAAHLVLSVVFAIAKILVRFAIGQVVPWLPTPPAMPGNLATLPINIAAYWAIVAISYAIEYHRRYRDREVSAAQLESRLVQAQLRVLQSQLQPHFLFNTLHSISVLIREGENDAADVMLTRLSDLLRLSLDAGTRQEQPLSKELEFVAGYVAIQQVRFQDRLTVTTDIDPAALDALVPALVLQPLVENAIQHGIAPLANGGRVEIVARREGAVVHISVRDDGAGMPATPRSTGGVGLSNTRERLARLYDGTHQFSVVNAEHGGVVAELRVPYRQGSGERRDPSLRS